MVKVKLEGKYYSLTVYFPKHWQKPIEENAVAVNRSVSNMVVEFVKERLHLE